MPVRLAPSAAGRCRRRVHLDNDPQAPRERRLAADDGARHRIADMDAHRDRVVQELAVAFPGAPEGASAWDVLDAGGRPPVVLGLPLASEHRVGDPEMVVWLGDGYVPVIVRSHRTTDQGAGAVLSSPAEPLRRTVADGRKPRPHQSDVLALAHLYRLLGEQGLASDTALGGVIGRGHADAGEPGAAHDDAENVLWHDLSVLLPEYDRRFADRLAVATAARAGQVLARPTRIGECRRCPWWPVCSVELEAGHDISLVSAGGDTEVLLGAGVRTVDQLARMPADEVAELPLTGIDPATARTRARAWLVGAPVVRRHGRITVPRADLELDVDMESYLDDGAYLWGTFLTGPAVTRLGLTAGYRPFASWRPMPDADEGRAFADFWGYLTELRRLAAEHGLTFAAYCYSRWAEERWLRSTPVRYPQVPGMPGTAAIEAFCSGPQWVDMYQQIRDQFIVPGSMKLKSLAPLAGFHWRDAEPGGENSMAWYRTAVGFDGAAPDVASAERVLRYNEDDVRATLALREWMTHRSGTVPTAAELDARVF
ncbi:TM0106 family RecB-like putative nuclease [Nakamurella sp. YIM 132087]|uniref:TM0106 family RecB-like putative nuclease n=2 Tax=Nakamurella alba TaxID=2665158 RepID=A0A7K1FNE5_9ACTN|nr:TM0106 family RecB-like putative nuclease [Nakamurella alba]